MAASCCSSLSNLDPWDCACSAGCDACRKIARCRSCGSLRTGGQVEHAQRAAGLCRVPWCSSPPAPGITRCRDHLSSRERQQYDAARRLEAAQERGARC